MFHISLDDPVVSDTLFFPPFSSYSLCRMILISVVYLCQTLCDHMGSSPPVSSVLGIFQAKLLQWVAPPKGDLPDLEIECASLMSPALQADSLPTEP